MREPRGCHRYRDPVTRPTIRPIAALIGTNILGGVGVASGIAVGALLVAGLGGTAVAGLGQAMSVLGAAIAAVPLADLAARRGRRLALGVGYAIAALGAVIIILGATLGWLWLTLIGVAGFGFAQATNLQSRYAASDAAPAASRGRTLSMVVWATTIGSVVGPNLSQVGADLGTRWGLNPLAGPYLFSLVAFVLAGLVVWSVYGSAGAAPVRVAATSMAGVPGAARPTARQALRWAAGHPVARFAVLLLVIAHAVMVGIMSMTPVHLGHQGEGLGVVGLVISLHILGMYALSPVFGWLADRFGALKTALIGLILLGASAVLSFVGSGSLTAVTVALFLLGLGWSAATIAASVLLARVDAGSLRIPLQGATDALMNYGGAAMALASGPLLAGVGFGGLALVAGLLIIPAAAFGWIARHQHPRG